MQEEKSKCIHVKDNRCKADTMSSAIPNSFEESLTEQMNRTRVLHHPDLGPSLSSGELVCAVSDA
jgi:hypothetical protein